VKRIVSGACPTNINDNDHLFGNFDSGVSEKFSRRISIFRATKLNR
jgi:hypothetical protein